MKKVGFLISFTFILLYSNAVAQQLLVRGQIIKAGSSVLDPNQDGFISKTTSGFSTSTNYWVPEFEVNMFGIPQVSGDVTGDNTGKACGITDLIPDVKGSSVYAVRDANNNLIFRFRVGDNNPSVEAWSILLDTDGKFGANDPNATADNPGFEVDISLIKNQNFGVIVYNIDGVDNCSNSVITYPLDTHFQISVADESTCGDPDYFYDFYVPISDLTNLLGVTINTGVRIVAVTNVSATCAMGGNVADISGVNNDDPQYKNCDVCAYNSLIANQCPTAIINLCETCSGFNHIPVNAPTINQPVRAGQASVSGTCDDGIYIVVQVYPVIAGTTNQWSSTPRETAAAYATGTNWIVPLAGALQDYDKIVATAQKDQNTPPCGLNGDSQSSTSVTVAQPNAPPVAQNQSVNVVEDTPTSITLVATDPDSDPLTYILVSMPTHGSLTGSGSSLSYTPSANYNGADSFTFKASDGIFTSNVATVTINVTPVNDPPVANNQSVTTQEDTPVNITLTGSDIEGSALTFIIVIQPLHGTLSGTGANRTYTPSANYNGVDNFTFKVNDGTVDSNNSGNVLITVTPVNDAPVANNQNVTVTEDTPKSILLSGSDADGDALTYTVLTQPSHGTLSGTAPNLTYTPSLNYNGSDSFTFKVNDGTVDSNIGTVSITVTPVNDAPVANNQSVTTPEDTPVAITLTASDVDGNALTYLVVTQPAHGTLTGTAPNLTYTPASNYNGGDSFTFKANDGTIDSNIATVSITVTPVNDAPVANNLSVTTLEDTPVGITLTGNDVDGNAITYTVITQPTHGTLSGTAPNLIFTPVANYNGSDSFTFKVNDGTVDSNVATVSITVTPVNDAPVANNQSVTTAEDTPVGITLVGTDVDGDALTYTVITPPSHGALTGTAPNLTYTPAPDYNGPDGFTFKVNDGTVDSNAATVSISVTPVNDAPVANNQNITTPEDTPVDITLTGSDADGNALTYTVVTSPSHGTLTGTVPNLTYTPALNYNGSDSFTFKVNDGTTDSNVATVSITVTPVNDAPVANNQSVTTPEDTPVPITLSGTDVDGDALTYTVVTSPLHGTLTGTAPNLTYTPAPNYNGGDSFTFKVNDGTVDSNTATVSITVTPVNDAPIANNQSVTTPEDTPVGITLTGSDVDGNSLAYIVVTSPAHGTLTGVAPNFTYTPGANYNGSDSFTFKVNDGTVDSNIATVSITVTPVNDAPVANNQTVTTLEDTPVAVTLTGSDVDGNALTYTVLTAPSHGTLTGTAPNLTYTPAANYNGSDAFTFKVNDGTVDSNIATVSITVTPVNDAPVANNQSVTVVEDVAKSIILSASDVDGNALTYTVVSSPAHGTLTGTAPNLTYTPAANYNGSDSFTFKANDGTVDSNIATVSITVTPVNDAPVANTQSVTTPEDTPVGITLTGSDVDGNALTYVVVTSPLHGTLTGSAPNLTYTPAANYNGGDSFTFKVNDGTVDSNIATVSITVTPVNDEPVANNKSVTTPEDTPVAIVLTGSDPEGDALTYSVVASPSHGTLSGTAPNLTYTPAANYNGSDSFTFKVNDGNTDSNTATVSITVTPVNDAPVANNQTAVYDLNTPKSITLTASDADGDALTYTVLTSPTHGTLSGTAPNLTYTPNNNFNGSDSFTFKVNDGTVDSNIATVSILFNPGSNSAPIAFDQSVVTNEDVPVAITLTASDPDGNSLAYIIVAAPTHGTLTGIAPNLTYTPSANYNGSDAFTFKANDGSVDSNTATVSITVTPVNDAPVANSQTVATLEDTSVGITLTGSDVEGSALTYSIVSTPAHGSLSGTAPNLTYTPAADYNGNDSFTFKVNDGSVDSNIATVTINITPVNDIPTANNQSGANNQTVVTPEDTPVAITLTASDVDGDPLTYSVVTPPTHGTLTGTAPNLTYTPAANYNGSDSFTFKVNDGTADSNTATVAITVTPVNDAPTTTGQTVTVAEDNSISITLSGTDVDGDVLTFIVVTPPAHGTLSGSGATLTYTPAADYNGNDSFTFEASDGQVNSNTSTVSIVVTPVNDVPTANNQSGANNQTVVTPEDTPVAITLTASDVDGDPLTYSVVTPPTHGTLTGTAPNLTYTPAANYNGSDSFTFKVNDGTADSNTATVAITVTPVNDAPNTTGQTVTVAEDNSISITLSGTDVDGDVLTFIVVTPPAHGTLSGSGATLTYTPTADYNGNDSFTFEASDGQVNSNTSTVSITVTPVNDPPTANNQSGANNQTVVTPEDTPVAITLTASDVDGDPLTYSVVTPPSHGTLTGTAPNLTYTPAANYNGSDSFTFKANDGTADSNTATVAITVTPVNDAPTTTGQTVTVTEDNSISITLSGTDVDGNALIYSITSLPTHGTLSGSGATRTYTPAPNYNGNDSFKFRVNDGQLNSNISTVSIIVTPVNDAPVANNQNVTTSEDTPLPIALTGSDVDGNALTYIVVTSPAHGTLTGIAPNLNYSPAANYNGSDSFTFKANDGTTDSNIATIAINVTPVDDAPIANNLSLTTVEETPVSLTVTGSDIDSNTLTFILVSPAAHGTISGTLPNVTYTPAVDFNGTDNFTFKINDGTLDSNLGTVFITVTGVNDAPLATSQSLVTNEDTPLPIVLAGTDPDGNAITFSVASQPQHGTLSGTAPNLTYQPSLNFNGTDSFTFTTSDGTLSSPAATISITVSPVNDAPIANNQSVALLEDTPTLITLSASDVENDILTYTLVSSPANGTLSGTPPNLTYTPSPNYFGIDAFTFLVNDGSVNSNTATISLTIAPVNDAPTTSDQNVTVDEDNSISIVLVGNDVDGDPLTYNVVTPPAHGTLSGSGASLTYTPDPDYNGNDSFTFEVSDGQLNSNISAVQIIVKPVNDPPTANNQSGANNQSVTTNEDTPVDITLTANDVDGDPLAFSVVSQPLNGKISGTLPNLTYTPDLNFNGKDSLTFKVNDGFSDSNIATVVIDVLPVNDPPVISPLPTIMAVEDVTRPVCFIVTDVDSPAPTATLTNVLGGGTMIQSNQFDFCYDFTPVTNYNGRSNWSIQACDDAGACTTVGVNIIVLPVNDAPVAIDDFIDNITARIDTTLEVLDNDLVIASPYKEFYDIYEQDSADVLTIDRAIAFNGTATIVDNGKAILYRSNNDFMGIDSIRYRIYDSGGLRDSAVVVFQVNLKFHIYHGISPNGDGKNDYWRIDKIEDFPNNTVRVFDRFNNLVFETRGYSNEKNSWSGQANHGLVTGTLPEGTYYYSVDLGNGTDPQSGFVILKR